MKTIQSLLLFIALGATSILNAQTVLQHVYVLNEGAFGNANGTLTKTNYPTYSASTTPVNNPSNFGTSLYMANNKLYAAFDTVVYTVDPTTMQKIDSIFIDGVRVAKVMGDTLYVTRDIAPYFQAYNLTTKNLVWSTSGLKGACEGFAFITTGNLAAVCVNGFGTEDTLAVINLTTGNITQQYATALNPQDVYVSGSKAYVFCTTNYTNSVITTIDVMMSTTTNTPTGLISYGGMTVDTVYQRLYFVATNGSFTNAKYWVKRFDLTSSMLIAGNTIDTVYTDAIYGIKYDHLNEQFFCGITDYFSFGKVNRYDKFGNLQDFFVTGVGPRSIVLQYGIGTGITHDEIKNTSLTVYPNPAQNYLCIDIKQAGTVQIWNSTGQRVKMITLTQGMHKIPVSDIPSGVYFVRTEQEMTKFLKQ